MWSPQQFWTWKLDLKPSFEILFRIFCLGTVYLEPFPLKPITWIFSWKLFLEPSFIWNFIMELSLQPFTFIWNLTWNFCWNLHLEDSTLFWNLSIGTCVEPSIFCWYHFLELHLNPSTFCCILLLEQSSGAFYWNLQAFAGTLLLKPSTFVETFHWNLPHLLEPFSWNPSTGTFNLCFAGTFIWNLADPPYCPRHPNHPKPWIGLAPKLSAVGGLEANPNQMSLTPFFRKPQSGDCPSIQYVQSRPQQMKAGGATLAAWMHCALYWTRTCTCNPLQMRYRTRDIVQESQRKPALYQQKTWLVEISLQI